MNYAAPSSEGTALTWPVALLNVQMGLMAWLGARLWGLLVLYGILHASSAAPDNAKPASATLRLLHVKWWTGDG